MESLAGFTAGLCLITLSELGDKTFFMGAILAMRHPRRWVFVGVSAALAVMTVLSVGLGQFAALLPQTWVKSLAIALFLGFGAKLLYDAGRMSDAKGLAEEQEEALDAVKQLDARVVHWSVRTILLEAFVLTFVAEWGDRTQFATVTLAASHSPYGVVTGAILGHLLCAAIAVLCGRMIAGRLSERWLMVMGGALFIVFGLATAAMGP
ncbi:TMEM165/GDT1 family protein [Lyngbya confervoides]|uniref:GDT1 family protein n=1 Tax=Lyngbya confervoides BDU141951 TaxID=1574623 RepID=A0ABD4T777_9CYAN|nr:TMEM165/GDT1 family protein [Lyngbya confervoides]MCM1984323.1 TMEM165/GDT1 family protein [Lyngbya confervoides BDU141951]